MGESKFTPEQLSGAISKTENDIEELKGSIKLIKKDMSGSLAKMSDIEEFKKIMRTGLIATSKLTLMQRK